MRSTAVALVALLAAAGRADPPSVGTIVVDSVVLRAAPKPDAADTGRLVRGATVTVHRAEGDDWLAIQPPAGSRSWISHLFVDGVKPNAPFPQNGTVVADREVRLAAGHPDLDKPLDVRKTAIPDGTLVKVLGAKVKADDGTSWWYPIEPPADDFRYIPKSAVKLTGPVGRGFGVTSPSESKSEWTAASKPAEKGTNPNHPLWADAERAEAAGQTDRAEELYFKLARESNGPGGDPELANLCYTRIHALRERKRQANTAPTTSRRTDTDPPRPAKTDDTPPPAKPTVRGGEWTGAGVLRGAWRSGGRLYYALEDDRGRVMAYAVSRQIDLGKYVGKTVDLYGPITRPAGFEKDGLVTVERVDLAR